MALRCDAFGAITQNSYRAAAQAADCLKLDPSYREVTPDEWRAGLLAGLLAANAAAGKPVVISAISPCDLGTVAKNMHCAFEKAAIKIPDLNADKFQGLVLYLINNLLCP